MRRRWTLGFAALALIGLPAFASPGAWPRFGVANAESDAPQPLPMPFEQAGKSFPGSAFYYLDLTAPAPAMGSGIHSDADELPPGQALTGSPAARAMIVDDTPQDMNRALQCMTQAIYYEAASEPDAGQRAVAQVVMNRVAHPAFPNTVCGVVYQGSGRPTGCQFTFTCDGALARRPIPMFWDRARAVARAALAGYVYAPVGLATHYHTVQVHPYWAPSLHYLETIGAHRFYALSGNAGSLAAFHFRYLGGEPIAAPAPREDAAAAAMDAAASDPLAIQKAYSNVQAAPPQASPQARGLVDTAAQANPGGTVAPDFASPIYSHEARERGGDNAFKASSLPQTNGVRPEYAHSGQWIGKPNP